MFTSSYTIKVNVMEIIELYVLRLPTQYKRRDERDNREYPGQRTRVIIVFEMMRLTFKLKLLCPLPPLSITLV